MATAQTVFASWLTDGIAPALRGAGYRRSGQDFSRVVAGNWVLLNFQRSPWSSAEGLKFTVNLGVGAVHVIASLGMDPTRAPSEAWCQVRARIGPVCGGGDRWWAVHADATQPELALLAGEVLACLVDTAIPWLESHAPDEAVLEVALGGDRKLDPADDLTTAGVLLHEVGGPEQAWDAWRESIRKARSFYATLEESRRTVRPTDAARAIEGLADRRPGRRADAAATLGWAKRSDEIVSALRASLTDEDPVVRASAVVALARQRDLGSLDRLLAAVDDEPNPARAIDIGRAIGRWAEQEPSVREQVLLILRGRQERAVGRDLAWFGAIIDRIEAPQGQVIPPD